MALGVVALIPAVLAACSTGPSACSAVGADSGVSVKVEPGLLSPAAPVAVTACVDGICQIQTYTPATSPIFVAVTPVNNGEMIVSVSLTAGAQQISTGKTATRTVKSQPNGPGCPPTVWEAKVIAHDNGHLSG